jgi:hypothetical protein
VSLFTFIQDANIVLEDSLVSNHSNISQEFISRVTAVQFSVCMIPAEVFTTHQGSRPLDEATTWDQVWISGAKPFSVTQPSKTPREFQKNVQRGVWSCLLLGFSYDGPESKPPNKAFFLVVEWKDDLTAVRADGFPVYGGTLHESSQMLEPRTVRLV